MEFLLFALFAILIAVAAWASAKDKKQIEKSTADERSRRLAIAQSRAVSDGFSITRQVLGTDNNFTFCVDSEKKKIMIATPEDEEPWFCNFSDILSYSVIEDGSATSDMASIVGSGILFGAAGAMVAASATQGSKKTCTDLHLEIVLKDLICPRKQLNFIQSEVNKDSDIYVRAEEELREITAILDNIRQENEMPHPERKQLESQQRTGDIYAEIEKLHTLKEKGIITDEEFQKKKRFLLGI